MIRNRPDLRAFVSTLVAFAAASSAFASDGVLEINQACAVQTGSFADDAPGYPAAITVPGTSYLLTSSLVVPDADTHGLLISTTNVTIDLGGFEILRDGCHGTTTSRRPALLGTGSGIERTGFLTAGVSVRNGTITGMGFYGVHLGNEAEIKNVHARWNAFTGIFASQGSRVLNNTAFENGFAGIFGNSISVISNNVARGNLAAGISAGSGVVVTNNVASSNGEQGILTSTGANVLGNTMFSNVGFGLEVSAQSGYRANVIANNSGGTVSGGLNLGENACDGSTTCP